MRKLILKMSVSADGFVGGPNGEIDWLLRSLDEESTQWIVETLWRAGVHIMGRRTFQDMISYWPYSREPLAAPMNAITKIVFSRKGIIDSGNSTQTTTALKDASALQKERGTKDEAIVSPDKSWTEATVLSGDLATEITRIKQEPGKDIVAHGGASFVQSLVKTGLIDEYQFLIHPVALGKGLPLFSGLTQPLYLEGVSTTRFKSGIVAQVYRPAK